MEALATVSVLKQIKSHWQTLSASSSPLCFAFGLLLWWQNCFDMFTDSQGPALCRTPLPLPSLLSSVVFVMTIPLRSFSGVPASTTFQLHMSNIQPQVWIWWAVQGMGESLCLLPGETWKDFRAFFLHPPSSQHMRSFWKKSFSPSSLHNIPGRMWPVALQYYFNLYCILANLQIYSPRLWGNSFQGSSGAFRGSCSPISTTLMASLDSQQMVCSSTGLLYRSLLIPWDSWKRGEGPRQATSMKVMTPRTSIIIILHFQASVSVLRVALLKLIIATILVIFITWSPLSSLLALKFYSFILQIHIEFLSCVRAFATSSLDWSPERNGLSQTRLE